MEDKMGEEELTGLDNEDINEPETESDAEKILRLEAENKNFKDGSSRLGREFKSYKEESSERYQQLLDEISALKELKSASTAGHGDDNLDSEYTDYEDEDIKRVRKIAREEAKKEREISLQSERKQRDKYINDYASTVNKLGQGEEDGVYEEILAEMESLPGYSNDGAADARRNYEIAERNYYKNKYKTSKSPTSAFRGEAPKGKIGGSSTVNYKEASSKDVDKALQDPHVQEYMKRRRKDVDFVKRAMANKTPLSGTMRLA